jgi:crotonobetainyl-CoA:carnitine CoA-transferase CaiB-like acyl-CoA transferase
MAPHGVYPAAGEDRWLAVAVEDDAAWAALCGVMKRPDLAADPRFADGASRIRHRETLDTMVSHWSAGVEANAAAEQLQHAGVAAHASWTTPEIAADAHLRQRGAIVSVAEPDGTLRAAVGVPLRLSKGEDIGILRGTPRLGEHEDYVYGEILGMGRAERLALEAAEVIH